MNLINDPHLSTLLSKADAEDLSVLADYITDKGEGRISLSNGVCQTLNKASKSLNFPMEVRALTAEELQRFGGNSLMNFIRGGAGVPYIEIARDVADHVKANYNARTDCGEIEMAILMKVLEKSLDGMDEAQKKQVFDEFGANYTGMGPASMAALITAIRVSGFGFYKMAAVVANASAKALLGRGLTFGTTATAMRGISALAGPIGWAITAIWTLFDLASPAYRVTVPCVIQVAYMRQKALAKQCPKCHASVAADAKFCSQCGFSIGESLALPA